MTARFDLDRTKHVRIIFEAIASNDVLGRVLDLYGEEEAPVVLAALTGPLNRGGKLSLWEKASFLYDQFGSGGSQ